MVILPGLTLSVTGSAWTILTVSMCREQPKSSLRHPLIRRQSGIMPSAASGTPGEATACFFRAAVTTARTLAIPTIVTTGPYRPIQATKQAWPPEARERAARASE